MYDCIVYFSPSFSFLNASYFKFTIFSYTQSDILYEYCTVQYMRHPALIYPRP